MTGLYSRIAVVGISGSGKTVFSRALAEKIGLPLYHMDSLFWAPEWREVPEEEWRKQESEILAKEQWILEGYIDEGSAERLKRADVVLYLDLPGPVCAFNGLKRWCKYRTNPRPEMAEGCTEKLDFYYLWTMLTRKERDDIEAALEKAGSVNMIRLESTRSIKECLNKDHV